MSVHVVTDVVCDVCGARAGVNTVGTGQRGGVARSRAHARHDWQRRNLDGVWHDICAKCDRMSVAQIRQWIKRRIDEAAGKRVKRWERPA